MNNAEYITAIVGFAVEEGKVGMPEAVRMLTRLATALNGLPAGTDSNDDPEICKIWEKAKRLERFIDCDKEDV